MNFVSPVFIVFCGLAYLVYWHIDGAVARRRLLLAASYLFYGFWDWRYCGLMLFVTANAYVAGRLLPALPATRRRWLLAVSVGGDLVVLGFFKYYGFFAGNLARGAAVLGWDAALPALGFLLPVGISFYTFHAISYVVDVYRGKVAAERSLTNVALYIAFFPQLIAGPIVRAAFFIPQLYRRPPFSTAGQGLGLKLILRGVIYKAVIADTLANLADPVFAHVPDYSTHALATALIAFYGQIYFDFAGYSAIAIGVARLFGYRIPKNFDYPYAAASLTEFWRRWHMSLSFWLRDYLYIPLGGNRGPAWAQFRSLMVTMLLGGLWHGASWNFVIWGGLHGLGLCLNRVWSRLRARLCLGIDFEGPLWRVIAIALTQGWVLCAWAFFRCHSLADTESVLRALVGSGHRGGADIPAVEIWVVSAIVVDHVLGRVRWPQRARPQAAEVARRSPAFWVGVGALAALAVAAMPIGQRPFIYFQF